MTVAELISHLKTMDQDAMVVISRNQTRLGDGDVTITDWEEGYFLADRDWKTQQPKDSGYYYGGLSYAELDDENKNNCVKAIYFC